MNDAQLRGRGGRRSDPPPIFYARGWPSGAGSPSGFPALGRSGGTFPPTWFCCRASRVGAPTPRADPSAPCRHAASVCARLCAGAPRASGKGQALAASRSRSEPPVRASRARPHLLRFGTASDARAMRRLHARRRNAWLRTSSGWGGADTTHRGLAASAPHPSTAAGPDAVAAARRLGRSSGADVLAHGVAPERRPHRSDTAAAWPPLRGRSFSLARNATLWAGPSRPKPSRLTDFSPRLAALLAGATRAKIRAAPVLRVASALRVRSAVRRPFSVRYRKGEWSSATS